MIPTKSYLHPGDEAAIQAVNSVPGLEKLMSFIAKNSVERYYDILFTSTYLKLTEKTSPKIYRMYRRACERFGIEHPPEIFLQRAYQCDTTLCGVERPKLLVSSALLELLEEWELEVFLASDIAAIKAGHGLMGLLLLTAVTFGGALPVPRGTITYPLYQWKRQSYYTLDRARLLYSDDFDLTMSLIECGQAPEDVMSTMTIEERLAQSEEFLKIGGGAGASKTVQTLTAACPWNANRLLELFNWKECGAYESVKEKNHDQL